MEYSDEDGTYRIDFFVGRIAPQCNIRQDISGLKEGDTFPPYTGDCVYIYGNPDIEDKDIPDFPDTVNYIYLSHNNDLDEFEESLFPENLHELHIVSRPQPSKCFPKNLNPLTLEEMTTECYKILPKKLEHLTICSKR
jgi:hypothetical protein